MRPSAFGVALWASACVALSFLLLPIVAIFSELTLGELRAGLTSDVARDALRVTLETNLVAMVLIVLFGTPTAYLQHAKPDRILANLGLDGPGLAGEARSLVGALRA